MSTTVVVAGASSSCTTALSGTGTGGVSGRNLCLKSNWNRNRNPYCLQARASHICLDCGFIYGLQKPFEEQASQVQSISGDACVYPRSPALDLGLTAAVSLMIAQIIINVSTGCICCCRRGPHQSNPNWKLALTCFIVSWFTFVVAFLLLLTGAALNDQHGEENMYYSYYNCYVVKPGVFSGAAILSLASVVLGLVYYYMLTSAKNINNMLHVPVAQTQGGVAMGQPQFPAPQAPVFVHEDTYLRRQVA